MIIKLTEIDFQNIYDNSSDPENWRKDKLIGVKVVKDPVYVNTNAIFSFRKCEHRVKLDNGDIFSHIYTEINIGEDTTIEVNENPEEIMAMTNALEAGK